MSYEKRVHEDFELPVGSYTTVVRLLDICEAEPYSSSTARRFIDNLPGFESGLFSQPPRVTTNEGSLFAEFRTDGLSGRMLAIATAELILPAITELNLTPRIWVGVDSSKFTSIEVTPEKLFEYMPNDASLAVIEAMDALKELPQPTYDFGDDLEMMFNAPAAIIRR